MKTLHYIGAGITVLSAALLLSVPASAQTLNTTANQDAPQASVAATAGTAATDRIEKRKAAFKTKLTNSQQNRIKLRCKNAQGKLQSVSQKLTAAQQNREKSYDKILDTITAVQPKLDAANVDTAPLATTVTELKAAIESFKASSAAYQEVLKDTAELDCQADPVAFQASLVEARAALQKVRSDAGNIRTVINQKLKPALVETKAKLTNTKVEQ